MFVVPMLIRYKRYGLHNFINLLTKMRKIFHRYFLRSLPMLHFDRTLIYANNSSLFTFLSLKTSMQRFVAAFPRERRSPRLAFPLQR